MARCVSIYISWTLTTISNYGFGIQEAQVRTVMHHHECRFPNFVIMRMKEFRTATPAELRSSLAASSGKLESRSTVRRRLHERSLYARQPAV
ncbi:hypothetical protein TNCV_5043061 [Trichonephila clavipes]|nr:hypothetical protein TNCV_5043061 [Trichonephila clavipes]